MAGGIPYKCLYSAAILCNCTPGTVYPSVGQSREAAMGMRMGELDSPMEIPVADEQAVYSNKVRTKLLEGRKKSSHSYCRYAVQLAEYRESSIVC